ncbi:hypothetical protein [Desulfitobacterium sp.]|uniref:hypothetical protein n=1 Tax=Desulfitobacterium sp. TaxID=49981 RepID=UPI002B1FFEA5|nr:hypothetical protein [Desulfitobacterium sp.]MEA4900477.1 hypothetical protein [Desulfitobacterium sp.]
MMIYNKKGFISGIIFLIICIIGLVSVILKGLSLKMGILLPLVFLFSITEIKRSLSRSASKEDITAANDERDQYIILKTSHKVLQIINAINYIMVLTSMVMYAVTKNQLWLNWLILSAAYFTVLFVTVISVNIYYEKHE